MTDQTNYEYAVEHVGPHGFVVEQPVTSKAHAERFAAKQPYDGRFPRIKRRAVGPWEPAPDTTEETETP